MPEQVALEEEEGGRKIEGEEGFHRDLLVPAANNTNHTLYHSSSFSSSSSSFPSSFSSSSSSSGKQHMVAVTALPVETQVTAQYGQLPLKHTNATRGYFAYGQPRDAMAYIEDRQRMFVIVAVVAQLLILVIMNYLTYQVPLATATATAG